MSDWQLNESHVRLQADNGTGTWPLTIGKVRQVTVVRGEAEPGTIRADVYDATLDVVTSTALRTGKPVRFQVANGGGWKTIAQGNVSNPAVDFDPRPGASVPVNVKVETIDLSSTLANTPESRGVCTAVDLANILLADVDFPHNVGGTLPAVGDVVATNDNASLWDQILICRDSVLGYAWISMDNSLYFREPTNMDVASKANLTSAVYSAIDLDFALDQIINTVTIKWRRFDIGSETSADVAYGPYDDADSVLAWGARTAEFTIQGETEVEADIVDFGQAILIRNAEAEHRARTVTVPIRTLADLALVRNVDINHRVTVTHPDGVTTKVLRVIGIEHNITPDFDAKAFRWFLTFTLALPDSVVVPSSTPGTGNNVLPDNVVTDDELDAVVTDLEDQVQDALDEANEAANFAQTKNSVYYKTTKPTAPPDGPFRRGDVWFDIDDGNKIYVYVDSPTNDFVAATGSYLTTPNGKLVVTPSGLFCYDAGMVLKFFLDAGTGAITMSGALLSGGDIQGATVTGGTVQTSSLVSRGIKMNSTFLIAYDGSGNPVLSINASTGAITLIGPILTAGTITGALFRTNTTGQRIQVRGDLASGVIDFYSGLAGETPGALDPATNGGKPNVTLKPSTVAANPVAPLLIMTAGTSGVGGNSTTSIVGSATINIGNILAPVTNLVQFRATLVSTGGDFEALTGTIRGQAFKQTQDFTTASAASCFLSTDGFFRRSTSSRRRKTDEHALEVDVEKLLALEPKTFRSTIETDDPDEIHVGFIAEDADELGLALWVGYDDEERPDSFAYERWVAALQIVARHEHERANQLEARVARLEQLIEERTTP